MAGFTYRLRKANEKRGYMIQGLDPVFDKIPPSVHSRWRFSPVMLIVFFLTSIIDATALFVAGFKPNMSFFVAFDDEANGKFHGQEALAIICQYIRQNYPDHVLILDAKDGDIGASNNGYAKRAFVGYGADAVTWDPYLGGAIQKQLEQHPGKGFIILGRTSNPEGTALQNLSLADGRRIFEATVDEWMFLRDEGHSIGFVAGATHPKELASIRKRVGAAPLLIPGVGKQGGDALTVANAGFGGKHGAMGINVSGASLYADSGPSFANHAGKVMADYQYETRTKRMRSS